MTFLYFTVVPYDTTVYQLITLQITLATQTTHNPALLSTVTREHDFELRYRFCARICQRVAAQFFVFFTQTVTVYSAERTFSKLKLINSFLYSSVAQTRLDSLALISTENEAARQLD